MPKWAFGELRNGGIRICKCGVVTLEDEMHICKLEDEMTDDPITKIEDEKTWKDLGKQAFLVMQGAMEEGATAEEATTILMAFYAGMFKGVQKDDDKEE